MILPATEAAAVALVTASYLDSKFKISADARLIGMVIKSAARMITNRLTANWNPWDHIAVYADRTPQQVAITYARPVEPKTTMTITKEGVEYPSYDNHFELESYTYSELRLIVQRLLQVLLERGVKAGDTLGLYYTNKPFLVFLWFALWNMGATPAFVNYKIKGSQLAHVVNVSGMSFFYVDPDVAANIGLTPLDAPVVVVDEVLLLAVVTSFKTPRYLPSEALRKARMPGDKACLIYTSGTTSLPKAAIMNWEKTQLSAFVVGPLNSIKRESTVYICMPLYHSTGSFVGLIPTLVAGGTAAIGSGFSRKTFWTQVQLVKATHILYVGEVMRYLISSPYHPSETQHEVQIAYGNGMRRDIWRDFKQRFHIPIVSEFYGATEAPTMTVNYQQGVESVGAVRANGWLVSRLLHTQQRIIRLDEDQTEAVRNPSNGFCVEAAVDEAGELLFALPKNTTGRSVNFAGYLDDLEATRKKIILNVFKKGDAWFRTGDLMRLDSEQRLYFVDRIGDTFRWKSENVSTGEVEAISLEFNAKGGTQINQCVCVGVQVPNHEGRAGFLVVDIMQPNDQGAFLKDFASHVIDNLPLYSRPVFMKLGPVQTTHNHKIAKNTFRNQTLPAGETGQEVIYWLDVARHEYVVLDEHAWAKMQRGETRL